MITRTINFINSMGTFVYSHPDFEIELTASSVNLFILEPDTYVPCDDLSCPDGKVLDGDELDACSETCPYLNAEKAIGSSFMMMSDEGLKAIIKSFREIVLGQEGDSGMDLTNEMRSKISAQWIIDGLVY